MQSKDEIREEIATLEATEFLVSTNAGTYGAAEAYRSVGCGDPQFADHNVYETVGGKRREAGPGEDRAPGYMRRINADAMTEARRRLNRLRRELLTCSIAGRAGESVTL